MSLVVNGERVPDAVIELEAESLRNRFEALTPEEREAHGLRGESILKTAREWARENVIERTLLRQEAQKDSSPIPEEEVQGAIEQLKKRQGGEDKFARMYGAGEDLRKEVEAAVRLDRLIGEITRPVSQPKTPQIAEFYRKNRDKYRTPEMVKAAHIVKNVDENAVEEAARSAIEQAQAELRDGAAFEKVADKYSDCKGNGGDLGYFPRGQMVEEFDQTVFSMEPGDVSSIFRTVFGFHIAKVHDRKPAGVKALAEVRNEIALELHSQRKNRALEQFVDRLRAKAEIHDAPAAEAVTGVKER